VAQKRFAWCSWHPQRMSRAHFTPLAHAPEQRFKVPHFATYGTGTRRSYSRVKAGVTRLISEGIKGPLKERR
jgi:hypothetical protein